MRVGRTMVAALGALVLLAGCGEDDSAPPPASGGETAVVWAVGDLDAREPAARAVVQTILRDDPDRVLYTGDVYEDGTAEDFAENFDPAYGPLASRTLPTPGNHEWALREEGYFPYWREALGRTVEPWYATRIAGWEVLSLNTQTDMGDGSPQHDWLTSALEESDDGCMLAFWHRPRFSAGLEHGDQPDVAPLWDAVAGRAALVVSGHEHNLQRLAPADGVVQFVSGAGGRYRHGLDHDDPRLAFGEDRMYGALRLELHPGFARHAFVNQDGEVLERGRVPCR